MEIIVRFVEGAHSQNGTSFWKIEDFEGRKYTVWDKDIADKLSDSIGKSIDVEVKVSQDGKFKNIRGINVTATATGSKTASTPAPSPTSNGSRDKSIIAQCLCKVVEPAPKTIEEAVEMYKKALELLK